MLWIFVGYLLLTVGLGFWQGRRTRSQEDFVLGGSKLPGWMLALSERATGESAWLLLGFTGFVYANGLSGLWIAAGCLAGICTSWIVLARKFRQEAARHQALTMPEYFSARFPDRAATIRLLSTAIIAFFFVFYVGAQFAGAGKTIERTFGLAPVWGQTISAVVIMAYASFGGFISVVAEDRDLLQIIVGRVVWMSQYVGEPQGWNPIGRRVGEVQPARSGDEGCDLWARPSESSGSRHVLLAEGPWNLTCWTVLGWTRPAPQGASSLPRG